MDRIADIFSMIVVLAIIATILASKNTSSDVKAIGGVFTNSIWTATHVG